MCGPHAWMIPLAFFVLGFLGVAIGLFIAQRAN